jgi:hypothetical protein
LYVHPPSVDPVECHHIPMSGIERRGDEETEGHAWAVFEEMHKQSSIRTWRPRRGLDHTPAVYLTVNLMAQQE